MAMALPVDLQTVNAVGGQRHAREPQHLHSESVGRADPPQGSFAARLAVGLSGFRSCGAVLRGEQSVVVEVPDLPHLIK